MSTITIQLDEKRLANLKAWADEAGQKVEDLARDLLEAYAEDAADDFTPEERAAIELGLKDIAEGRTIPHEQVMAEAKRRFGG